MYWSAATIPLVPAELVTRTLTVVPEVPAGLITVSDVPAPLIDTVRPTAVPNLTPVAPVNPAPVTVTVVPPAAEPLLGDTPVTVATALV